MRLKEGITEKLYNLMAEVMMMNYITPAHLGENRSRELPFRALIVFEMAKSVEII